MSQELLDFSALIDEQFEIEILEEETLGDYFLTLFK